MTSSQHVLFLSSINMLNTCHRVCLLERADLCQGSAPFACWLLARFYHLIVFNGVTLRSVVVQPQRSESVFHKCGFDGGKKKSK